MITEHSIKSSKESIIDYIMDTFTICHNKTINKLLGMFLLSFSFINTFTFIYDENMGALTILPKDFPNIQMIFRVFSISYYLELSTGTMTVSIIVIFFYNVISAFWLLLLTILASKDLVSTRWEKYYNLYYINSAFLYWVFLCPFLKVCLHVITFYSNFSIVYPILAGLSLLLTVTLTTIHGFCGNKAFYDFKRPDSLARVDTNFEVIYLFTRVFQILILSICVAFKISFWYYIVYTTLESCYYMKFNSDIMLYYMDAVSSLFSFLIIEKFILNIFFIFINILHSYVEQLDNIFFIAIFTTFLVFFVNYVARKRGIKKLLMSKLFNLIDSPIIVDKLFKILIDLMHSKENPDVRRNENLILFDGILENQSKDIDFPESVFITKESFYIPKLNKFVRERNMHTNSEPVRILLLYNLYKYFLFFDNYNAITLISYCNFQFCELGNYFEIFVLINKMMSDKVLKTIQQKFSINRMIYINKIAQKKESLIKMENRVLDVNNVIKYYELINDFKIKITEVGNLSFQFWNQILNSAIADFDELNQKGIEIYKLNKDIEKCYYEVSDLYPSNIEVNSRMYDFCRLILGNQNYGKGIVNKKKELFEKEDLLAISAKFSKFKNLFYSNDSAILIASHSGTFSNIERVSDSIVGVFGYNPQFLVGKNLEVLMPEFFSKRHNEYIKFHVKTGIRRIINNYNTLYGKNNNENIFPLTAVVTPFPNLDNTLQFLSIVKKADTDHGLLLVDYYGRIHSINEVAENRFQITQEALKKKAFYIYYILTNLVAEISDNIYLAPITQFNKNNENRSPFLTMQCCENKLMMVCHVAEKINLFAKCNQTEYNENDETLYNNKKEASENMDKFLHYISKYKYNFFKDWVNLRISIIKLTYNNNDNPEEHTAYIVKIYFKSEEEESLHNNLEEAAGIANKAMEKGLDVNERMTVKRFDLKKGTDQIVEKKNILDIKNMITRAKKEKLHHDKNNESHTSSMSSKFMEDQEYNKRTSLRKKIKEYFLGKGRSNGSITIIKILILIFSLVYYTFYLKTQNDNLDNLSIGIKEQIENLEFTPSLNCMQVCLYGILLNKFTKYNNRDQLITHLYKCMREVKEKLGNYRNLYKVQLIKTNSKSSLDLTVNFTSFDTSISSNTNFNYIEYLEFIIVRLEKSKIEQGFANNNSFINHLKGDFFYLTNDNIMKMLNTTSRYLDIIGSMNSNNILFFVIFVFAQIVLFCSVIPFFIIRKERTSMILESLLNIKKSNIKKLYIEPLKKFLGNSIIVKKSKKGGKNLNNPLNEEEDFDQNRDNGGDMNKLDEEDEDNELNSKNYEKKKAKSKSNITRKKPLFSFVVKILAYLFLIQIVIMVIPLTAFLYLDKFFDNYESILRSRDITNKETNTLIRLYINIQSMYAKGVAEEIPQLVTPFQKDYLIKLHDQYLIYNKEYSSILTKYNDFNYYDQFKTILNDNVCDTLKTYNYDNKVCLDFYQNSNMKGLNSLLTLAEQGINFTYFYLTNIPVSFFLGYVINVTSKRTFRFTELYYPSILKNCFRILEQIYSDSVMAIYNDVTGLIFKIYPLYLFFLFFGVLVMWRYLDELIHELTDTNFKLFLVLPDVLVAKDNTEINAAVKQITSEID